MGVNEVYVSELTVRNGFQPKINRINQLLKQKSGLLNFKVIDHSNIRRIHLKHDGLHLCKEGTIILANNFINALNQRSFHDNWYWWEDSDPGGAHQDINVSTIFSDYGHSKSVSIENNVGCAL